MECQALRNGKDLPGLSLPLLSAGVEALMGRKGPCFSGSLFLKSCTPEEEPRELAGNEPEEGFSQVAG